MRCATVGSNYNNATVIHTADTFVIVLVDGTATVKSFMWSEVRFLAEAPSVPKTRNKV